MGTSSSVDGRAPIHIFASDRCWIEGEATRQLAAVAAMPGVSRVAAMPDMHPGKYGPVGCAILAAGIHPEFVGADIGCGMGLFSLDVAARKLRPDKAAERLRVLGDPWDGDPASGLAQLSLPSTPYDASLGSIGGGNHFCELQAVDSIFDPDLAARHGIDAEAAFVLVHSGSRGLGFSILSRVLAAGLTTLDPALKAGADYLADHDQAVRWAELNRRIIAERAAAALRSEAKIVNDLAHNLAEVTPAGVLHRKGAAAADRGLVPVPGSRGTLSYLVEPLAAARPETLASIAHGAGRKYDRSSMHGRVTTKKSELARLVRNPYGGVVVCEDRNLLIEEAPDAYRDISRVIGDLESFGLARVVASFRPLVTFKSVQEAESRDKVQHRDKHFVDKRAREVWR